jgi:hypothetical protein
MSEATLSPVGGLYEHWYGTLDLSAALRYWAQLGFSECARGTLDETRAARLYGHASPLESVRLKHRSGSSQGLIRVLQWERPAGEGLGFSHALATGSRWSGFYTRDLVQIQDAYRDEAAATGERWKVSDLARLFISDAKPGFYKPFLGIRESTIVGPHHRHAFLQRVGFDRPGFGTFAPDTPLPVTESTHGNVVLPAFELHAFYQDALGLAVQTPPMTIDWTLPAVRHSLELKEGESFQVIVYQTPGVPTGFLRVYAASEPRDDVREQSRPGHIGNCAYSYRYAPGTLDALRARLEQSGANGLPTGVDTNEFGEATVSCIAPDGYFWNFIAES